MEHVGDAVGMLPTGETLVELSLRHDSGTAAKVAAVALDRLHKPTLSTMALVSSSSPVPTPTSSTCALECLANAAGLSVPHDNTRDESEDDGSEDDQDEDEDEDQDDDEDDDDEEEEEEEDLEEDSDEEGLSEDDEIDPPLRPPTATTTSTSPDIAGLGMGDKVLPTRASAATEDNAETSAVSPPLAGRSTPALGIANALSDVLNSPREGGVRKRRRELNEGDGGAARLPTVARFSTADAAVQPWSVPAAVPRPRKGYMQHQPHISHPLRAALIDWLVDVGEVYRFRIHTLYAAVNYLDRFLSKIAIGRKVLQLTGVTCLMLAAKYEEINPPSVEEFAYITDSTYTRESILKMECAVLDVLKFELRVDSPLNYTEYLLVAADACDSARELCAYLIMLTTVDAEVYLAADPEIIAASAVVLALNSLHESALPDGLAAALARSNVDLAQVWAMSSQLHRTHCAKNFLSVSLHRKFSSMDHHMVARLRPAGRAPVVATHALSPVGETDTQETPDRATAGASLSPLSPLAMTPTGDGVTPPPPAPISV